MAVIALGTTGWSIVAAVGPVLFLVRAGVRSFKFRRRVAEIQAKFLDDDYRRTRNETSRP